MCSAEVVLGIIGITKNTLELLGHYSFQYSCAGTFAITKFQINLVRDKERLAVKNVMK